VGAFWTTRDLVGTADQLLLLTSSGLVGLGQDRLIELPYGFDSIGFRSGAEAVDGSFVIGGEQGTLIRLVPAERQPSCTR
jgi:hypothetical protein